MKVIGLTGGIGSGKSTVSEYLESRGYTIIDADKIAREIVSVGSETLDHLVAYFGTSILREDGSLNRKKLADIVFADPVKRSAMDDIMLRQIISVIHERLDHFRSIEATSHKIEAQNPVKDGIVFLDAALLYESGLDAATDKVWLVDADEEIRIRRVVSRDNMSEKDIKRRIKSQMAREDRLTKDCYVLDNSGSVKELYSQIDCLLAALQQCGSK